MSFRFRKSVKICKGFKVNFSKSGASLSVGGRGHSVNLRKRSRATFGIPGTGLSYSTSLTSNNNSAKRSTSSSGSHKKHTTTVRTQVRVILNDDGKIELRDSHDRPITDPSMVRKIKATEEYKNLLQNLEIQRQQSLSEAYNVAKEENERFINIHTLSPQVDRLESFSQLLNNLSPEIYTPISFSVQCPNEKMVREILTSEAKANVTGSILKVNRLRKEYVEEHLHERMSEEISKWEEAKRQFDEEESKNAAFQTEKMTKEFEAQREYIIKLINGDPDIVNNAVESWLSSCELPVEINVDYEWYPETGVMFLDVDLPEIEDLPENETIRLASGNLKEKKKTQATLKQEYVTLVFGLAIFISANIFNMSPAIHDIIISGYTQRRNKAGDINDEYVYSIKFKRSKFEDSILVDANPLEFCMEFENRCNITSTMLLKKITPYEAPNN